jgi:hypothetical protein
LTLILTHPNASSALFSRFTIIPMSSSFDDSVFVPPTDPNYLSLKAEYAFNGQALRSQFLDSTAALIRESQMLAKLHNLLFFRLSTSASLPVGLFHYSCASIDVQMVSQALKSTILWTDALANYDLGMEIEKLYPGIPWIVDYFIFDTFPSTFGNFLSEEYLRFGLGFIVSHIKDRLAPRLVGSYLMQCALFKDRLMERFFERIEGEGSVIDLFGKALGGAVSYLSQFHVEAVQRLKEVSEEQAIEAVLKYCLIPIVELWSFSPRFQLTGIVQVRLTPRPSRYLAMKYERCLVAELTKAQKDLALGRTFLGYFESGKAVTEYPKATRLAFYGGIVFPLSLVDIRLIQQLAELLKRIKPTVVRPRPVTTQPSTAAEDAFAVFISVRHVMKAGVEEPERRDPSPHLTLLKLQEHRELHNFLFGISGGMKRLDLIVSSQQRNNALLCRAFANRLFRDSRGVLQPSDFLHHQRRIYAGELFNHFMNPPFVEFIHSMGEPVDVTMTTLGGRIDNLLAERVPPALAVIRATIDHVNHWKRMYNAVSRCPQQLCLELDDDVSGCQFFIDEIEAIGLELVFQRLSACPHAIGRTPVSPLADGRCDSVTSSLMQLTGPIASLIIRADAAAREARTSGLGLGDWAAFFLELEALLRGFLAAGVAEFLIASDPQWSARFIRALSGGQDPKALREWLRQVLGAILESGHPSLAGLSETDTPISPDIRERFSRVGQWFGFAPDAVPPDK